MISLTKNYSTKNGFPVRILCTDLVEGNFPVVGLVCKGDTESIHFWDMNGENPHATNFNLVEVNSFISMNKKYQTVSGLPVRLFCTDRADPVFTVIGTVAKDGVGPVCSWTKSGRYNLSRASEHDLVEVSNAG